MLPQTFPSTHLRPHTYTQWRDGVRWGREGLCVGVDWWGRGLLQPRAGKWKEGGIAGQTQESVLSPRLHQPQPQNRPVAAGSQVVSVR